MPASVVQLQESLMELDEDKKYLRGLVRAGIVYGLAFGRVTVTARTAEKF